MRPAGWGQGLGLGVGTGACHLAGVSNKATEEKEIVIQGLRGSSATGYERWPPCAAPRSGCGLSGPCMPSEPPVLCGSFALIEIQSTKARCALDRSNRRT